MNSFAIMAVLFGAMGQGEPLQIVHTDGATDLSQPYTFPCTGYIDSRGEFGAFGGAVSGVVEARVLFNRVAFGDAFGGPVTVANFELLETGGGDPPVVTAVEMMDESGAFYRVWWDRTPTLQEWTTLRAIVFDSDGESILQDGDNGSQGEPDRIVFGVLPGDIDTSGRVQVLDLLRFRRRLQAECDELPFCPICGEPDAFFDMNRDGLVNPFDLLRWRQHWFGVGGVSQAWAQQQLNEDRP